MQEFATNKDYIFIKQNFLKDEKFSTFSIICLDGFIDWSYIRTEKVCC